MTLATKITPKTNKHNFKVALNAMPNAYSTLPRKRNALNMRKRRRMRNNRHTVSPWPTDLTCITTVSESATLTLVTSASKMFHGASADQKKDRPAS
eukprot:CAMPEP_0198578688 /NCGR_PEP_ID=MMETSP1462-20131121/120535_1 /TAXON_ID=1333877 /ORGANISM="Brandtodinium nutriculum, Strain RCC3387" /LENGTH=95 /DNA_ID=CAMNT_0044309993 /DNA_START=87 /DNA_END=371 /DNA_ORIENTATION=-